MSPRPAVTLSIQNLQQKNLLLLKRAKRGDRTAKKKLRNVGLLYWEHKGRVILKKAMGEG